ncbi:MAG TPA: response regulator [Burkholderiaceae bacterium]|nr:response regulator [Burkholderiaceae bacterium]
MAPRAYVIEDHPSVSESLTGALVELAQVDVVGQACSEGEACSWLAQHPDDWDLVIIDIFLKQGSGIGVLAACKDRKPGQKVAVLTGYATPEIRRVCMDFNADAVFDKGTDTEALIEYCRELTA